MYECAQVEEADLLAHADSLHVAVGLAHRAFLAALAAIDDRAIWQDDGARDAAHWVSMRYGVSA